MKKIIVMSDSHGDPYGVESVIRDNLDADMFIHLGDGERETAQMRIKYSDFEWVCIDGNCDWSAQNPKFSIVEVMGNKIFCTHGHRYSVKSGTETLRSAARDNGCCAALFGHTHERYQATEDGIEIMNPGSCACPRDGMKPSYGQIIINDEGTLFMNIFDVGI